MLFLYAGCIGIKSRLPFILVISFLFIFNIFILLLYGWVLFLLFFTTSFFNLYFIFELLWMLLILFFIIDNSIWRGIINYLIMNSILSIVLILGILITNYLLIIIGCFGKVGYFPFFLVYSYIIFSCSYLFLIYNLFNKVAYLCSLLVIFNISIFFNSFNYWLILISLIIILSVIKFLGTIKHSIWISSIILFNLLFVLVLIKVELFLINYIFFYLVIIYFFNSYFF